VGTGVKIGNNGELSSSQIPQDCTFACLCHIDQDLSINHCFFRVNSLFSAPVLNW